MSAPERRRADNTVVWALTLVVLGVLTLYGVLSVLDRDAGPVLLLVSSVLATALPSLTIARRTEGVAADVAEMRQEQTGQLDQGELLRTIQQLAAGSGAAGSRDDAEQGGTSPLPSRGPHP